MCCDTSEFTRDFFAERNSHSAPGASFWITSLCIFGYRGFVRMFIPEASPGIRKLGSAMDEGSELTP
jgi:hypothetical protein